MASDEASALRFQNELQCLRNENSRMRNMCGELNDQIREVDRQLEDELEIGQITSFRRKKVDVAIHGVCGRAEDCRAKLTHLESLRSKLAGDICDARGNVQRMQKLLAQIKAELGKDTGGVRTKHSDLAASEILSERLAELEKVREATKVQSEAIQCEELQAQEIRGNIDSLAKTLAAKEDILAEVKMRLLSAQQKVLEVQDEEKSIAELKETLERQIQGVKEERDGKQQTNLEALNSLRGAEISLSLKKQKVVTLEEALSASQAEAQALAQEVGVLNCDRKMQEAEAKLNAVENIRLTEEERLLALRLMSDEELEKMAKEREAKEATLVTCIESMKNFRKKLALLAEQSDECRSAIGKFVEGKKRSEHSESLQDGSPAPAWTELDTEHLERVEADLVRIAEEKNCALASLKEKETKLKAAQSATESNLQRYSSLLQASGTVAKPIQCTKDDMENELKLVSQELSELEKQIVAAKLRNADAQAEREAALEKQMENCVQEYIVEYLRAQMTDEYQRAQEVDADFRSKHAEEERGYELAKEKIAARLSEVKLAIREVEAKPGTFS